MKSVRSSIARRLGVDIGAVAPVDSHVEGVVEMVLDATSHAAAPLTAERLFAWQAALFPTGYSGLSRIAIGQWRDDAEPMQVVSGPVGRRKVHFQAPPAHALPVETARFLSWANAPASFSSGGEPALVKAGLAHLWFVTLHPFDDGNGRIARGTWNHRHPRPSAIRQEHLARAAVARDIGPLRARERALPQWRLHRRCRRAGGGHLITRFFGTRPFPSSDRRRSGRISSPVARRRPAQRCSSPAPFPSTCLKRPRNGSMESVRERTGLARCCCGSWSS